VKSNAPLEKIAEGKMGKVESPSAAVKCCMCACVGYSVFYVYVCVCNTPARASSGHGRLMAIVYTVSNSAAEAAGMMRVRMH